MARVRVLPSFALPLRRCLSTHMPKSVKIMEVGPRDGLQNEKAILGSDLKIELIRRLVNAGLRDIEAGSFVSPKWVPQMATTSEILSSPIISSLISSHSCLNFPVLVPNLKGLDSLLALPTPRVSSEIAIFISASESFSHANLNCSIEESVARLEPVVKEALSQGLRVRGYLSVVAGCPFEGRVDKVKVAELSLRLLELGCYEVSLGDTIGVGTPETWREIIDQVRKKVKVRNLAAHCHDTYGTAVASVLACVEMGVPTIDASISGLGGCPYSPGATGNVATEDVVYALESSGISTGVLPLPAHGECWDDLLSNSERATAFAKLAEVGEWIGENVRGIKSSSGSRAGRAVLASRDRRLQEVEKRSKSKL